MIYNCLFINQPTSDYGQSLLIHGLKKLGHKVTCLENNPFFFKSLKECSLECDKNDSPCRLLSDYSDVGCLNHPAHLTLKERENEDYSGINIFEHADFVITNNGYGREEVHRKLSEKGIPIAVLDLGDSLVDSRDAWRSVIGNDNFIMFRREHQQGQKAAPLSYSFYEEKSIFLDESLKKYDVSFLSRPTSPLRQVYSSVLRKFKNSFIGEAPHSQYLDIIAQSKFSVAVRGAGYDTLRRWEIPARGSVLCLERSPITINYDFDDCVNCIKFSSPEELTDKIDYYLNNYDGYNKLRTSCYAHFMKYHTTKERASQFLRTLGK